MTERRSEAFRRGLTLGLTLAEVFILILFLSLLVLLALYTLNAKTNKEFDWTKTELEETQTKLEQTTTTLETERDRLIANIRTLSSQKKFLEESLTETQADYARTKTSLAESEQGRAQAEQGRALAEETSEQIREELTETTSSFEAERSQLIKNMERLNRAIEQTRNTLADTREESTATKSLLAESEAERQTEREAAATTIVSLEQIIAQAVAKTTELTEQLATLQQGNAQLREELYASKGIDPPCWYKVESRQGERYEQPYYLMDVAVYDLSLRIRINPPPPGRSIDERERAAPTSYAEEYAILPLAPVQAKEDLGLQEFATLTSPILRMGKDKQIREYSCVFYVRVWDFTSATAKERWQQAEEAIGQSFYITRVRNDPWDPTNAAN